MNQENIPIAQPVETPPKPPSQLEGASGRAWATMIFGVLSLLCMGFMAGIPAIILGSMELKAIKAGLAPKEGQDITKIGYILGIVGTVLTCLAMIVVFVIIALGLVLGTSGVFENSATSV